MGGLLSPSPPKPKETPAAPDPDSEGPLAIEAKKRRMAKRQNAGGRQSTILTSGGAGGTGDYSGGAIG
jgi:hypothetical protein